MGESNKRIVAITVSKYFFCVHQPDCFHEGYASPEKYDRIALKTLNE